MKYSKPDKRKRGEAPEVTLRVIAIRTLMYGDSQRTFARWLGISISRWNNFEKGFPISRDIATLLVSRIEGLSVDWLWFGLTGNMSKPLLRRLEMQTIICRRGIS